MIRTFNDNLVLFCLFLLNAFAGYFSDYLNFWIILPVVILNDFILVCLLVGLKGGVKGEKMPGLKETLKRGRGYILSFLAAHFAVLFLSFSVMLVIMMVTSSLHSFIKSSILATTAADFFLVFIYSFMIFSERSVIGSFWEGFRIFFVRARFYVPLLLITLSLAFISLNSPSELISFLMFALIIACAWFIYLELFVWLSKQEAMEEFGDIIIEGRHEGRPLQLGIKDGV